MPRFAANLTMMFTEHAPLDRFAAAAQAGFTAVEVLFPYDHPSADYRARIEAHGLALVLINVPPGNWAAGERGCAAVPGQEARFRRGLRQALAAADILQPRFIHVLSGITGHPAARATFVANLAWAAALAGQRQLTVEPINHHDMPGYWLDDFDLAAGVLDEVGAPNLGLQFDAYHAHRITGDVSAAWSRHGHRAVHVQVAGHPGRHEPLAGDIDYPAFFARLDADGYGGWVSGEYRPRAATRDGLAWAFQQA